MTTTNAEPSRVEGDIPEFSVDNLRKRVQGEEKGAMKIAILRDAARECLDWRHLLFPSTTVEEPTPRTVQIDPKYVSTLLSLMETHIDKEALLHDGAYQELRNSTAKTDKPFAAAPLAEDPGLAALRRRLTGTMRDITD